MINSGRSGTQFQQTSNLGRSADFSNSTSADGLADNYVALACVELLMLLQAALSPTSSPAP